MAQTCNRCGAIAGDGAYFCPQCSNRLTGPTFAGPASLPARRSRLPFVLLALGLCLIVGAGAAFAYVQVGQIRHTLVNALVATYTPAVYVPPPETNFPPVGVIWFGPSFDATTFEMSDHAGTFAAGDQVAMVAHSTRTIPEGQTATISFDSYDFPTKAASAGGFDLYGMVISSAFLTVGSHTVILKDIGGNELARGTLTVR